MGILDTIRAEIAAGFKGKLRTGTLRRTVAVALDSAGDAATATVHDYKFDGIRDSFDKRYAAQAGIPETDVRILLIAGSLSVVPRQTDKILIDSAWFQVRRIVEIDPATATYTLQAYQIEAP